MMAAQCSNPFCLGLPEWTAYCQEDTRATPSNAVAADINKRFISFLTADESEWIAVGYIPKKHTK